jgi:hypothetical protein
VPLDLTDLIARIRRLEPVECSSAGTALGFQERSHDPILSFIQPCFTHRATVIGVKRDSLSKVLTKCADHTGL